MAGDTFLTGWRTIARAVGVPVPVVKGWFDLGAPIVVLPGKKPVTLAADLWRWLKEEYG